MHPCQGLRSVVPNADVALESCGILIKLVIGRPQTYAGYRLPRPGRLYFRHLSPRWCEIYCSKRWLLVWDRLETGNGLSYDVLIHEPAKQGAPGGIGGLA